MGTHTREIQIAGYNRWYRGYISVDGVSTVNDTTSRITITAALDDKYAAQYGTHYDVIVNGTTYRSRDVLLNNYGNWATRDAVTFSVDVGRGASGWNCSVQIHVCGKTYNNYYGSAGGDAWATEYAWIPQRGYSQPHPPKNPKLARVSDTSHKITWDVDYTGMDGAVHEVWFEDVRSSLARFHLVKQYALRGLGYWNFMRPFTANFSLANAALRLPD